jgi:HTH-type transcriptional repressor of NAD biosynthesis genes
MPPTKGHLHLIQFANSLGVTGTHVIVGTQPDEPFPITRVAALREATRAMPGVKIHHLHREIEQNPESPGFRDMWRQILQSYGMAEGDYFVASEEYGKWCAEVTGGVFVPYDPYREILQAKGTRVRNSPARYFSDMIPQFQKYILQTVTIFGAESTGKTTLSKELAKSMNGHFLMEWARPYLETCGTEITTDSMTAIWRGQKALQIHAQRFFQDKPWIIQDTDLFSTVGYWDFWDMNTPEGLVKDALAEQSGLYLITQSNIPFEEDPIRYGGDKRESDDQYWIDLAERHGLNYRIIQSGSLTDRLHEAEDFMVAHWKDNVVDRLHYDRLY